MDFLFVCHKLTNVRESAMLSANELLSNSIFKEVLLCLIVHY